MSFSVLPCKQNVLILSCLGGSCHESARKAIEAQFESQYNFHVVYPLQSLEINKLLNPENLYNYLLRKGQKQLVNLLASHIPNGLISTSEEKLSLLFEDLINTYQPVLMVSVLPLINKIAIQECSKAKIPFCLITLDTDLTIWTKGLKKIANLQARMIFTVGCDLPETRGKLEEIGLKKEQIRSIGFPLRQEFYSEKPPRDQLCQELNLPINKKIILLMNGGSGGDSIFNIAKILAIRPLGVHFVVVAGRNIKLQQDVEKISLNDSNTLSSLGFTNRIADLMRVSKLLITKPGPGTVFEASAIYRKYQMPYVLLEDSNCLFWEQNNIRIVEEGGFGETFQKRDLLESVTHHLIHKNPIPKLDKMPIVEFSSRIGRVVEELIQAPI